MDKRFLIIMGVIVAAFAGLMIYGNLNKEDTGEVGKTSNHTKGNNSKNVEFVVYSDFQCPACGGFEPIIQEVTAKYSDEILYTFRNFPIDTIHPNARAAHRAGEAAGAQGKFWEMHDMLFANQQQWSSSQNAKTIFDSYAEQLGLNIEEYNAVYASSETNSTINADKQEGQDKGVSGTPSFFINGDKINNSDIQTVESFSAVIEEYIAKSNN